MEEPHSSNFRVITTNFLGVRIIRKFTVHYYSDNFKCPSIFTVPEYHFFVLSVCIHSYCHFLLFHPSRSTLNSRLISSRLQKKNIAINYYRSIHQIEFLTLRAMGCIVSILSFQTDRSAQHNVDPDHCSCKESDQGLHSLPFRLHLLDTLLYFKTTLFKF